MKNQIIHILIHLDDNIPEYMDGIIRCGGCDIEYADGSLDLGNDKAVDNMEFHEDEYDALRAHVASIYGIAADIVEIE